MDWVRLIIFYSLYEKRKKIEEIKKRQFFSLLNLNREKEISHQFIAAEHNYDKDFQRILIQLGSLNVIAKSYSRLICWGLVWFFAC